MRRSWWSGAVVAVAAVLVLGACGDGEDRPGEVTTESKSGTGTGSASGTGSGTGSVSGTGAHDEHGDTAEAAFTEAEADSAVHATMTDYAFALPNTIKGPKVFFEVMNDGPGEHEFLVQDAAGREIAEIEPFAKGEEKTLAVELAPGSYKVVCLVKEGEKTHQELGMESSFTVE